MNGTWTEPEGAWHSEWGPTPINPAANPGGLDFSHLPLIALGVVGLLFWVLKK